MSTTPPDPTTSGGDSNGNPWASASSVAGLAREIDALRHDLMGLLPLPGRLDELAGLLARLAEATAAPSPTPGSGVISWLDLPDQLSIAEQVLTGLIEWMARVYLRYPDAAAGLPDCWAWHPDVIEELLWLQHAWLAAYHDEHAPISAAADWHDRYRPGVVRRITTAASRCSLENHQPHTDRPPLSGPVTVPLAPDVVGPIATWWATNRQAPGPVPTPDQLATTTARRRNGSRR